MGRGLSGLQKTILRLGLEAHEAGEPTDPRYGRGLVYYEEVLLEHWRIPEPRSLQEAKQDAADPDSARRKWARRHRGWMYRKWKDYTEATPYAQRPTWDLPTLRAALSRAIRRLEARGLAWGHQDAVAFRRRSCINLTRAGIEEARRLKEAGQLSTSNNAENQGKE